MNCNFQLQLRTKNIVQTVLHDFGAARRGLELYWQDSLTRRSCSFQLASQGGPGLSREQAKRQGPPAAACTIGARSKAFNHGA